MCLKATSDSAQQQQDDQNQEDQSDSAAGIGSPGLTVAPSGQGAHEKKDQDDDQDDSHDFFLLSSFLKSRIPVNRASCSIRERITVAYFTIRLFFTVVTPLTLLAIWPALSTAC